LQGKNPEDSSLPGFFISFQVLMIAFKKCPSSLLD